MFLDRQDAGRKLAKALRIYQDEKPLILALPRGGVPVGFEVAQALKAPLDIIVARKVGLPWNPELGIGAVAPGAQILDEASLQTFRIKASDLKEVIEREQQELKRRLHLYRQGENFPPVTGKTVILVDDGLATGVTTRAAIQSLKQLKPAKLILAVPVGPPDTVGKLKGLVDTLICLEMPASFYAVGAFYLSFPQVSDEEVITLLNKAKQERKRPHEEL